MTAEPGVNPVDVGSYGKVALMVVGVSGSWASRRSLNTDVPMASPSFCCSSARMFESRAWPPPPRPKTAPMSDEAPMTSLIVHGASVLPVARR